MSETLQRYREDTEWGAAVMFPHEKGEYVKYADARRRIEELERALRDEEQEHERTITHRDAAEDTIATLYLLITGREAVWSNLFGYEDVVNEVSAAPRK